MSVVLQSRTSHQLQREPVWSAINQSSLLVSLHSNQRRLELSVGLAASYRSLGSVCGEVFCFVGAWGSPWAARGLELVTMMSPHPIGDAVG